MLELRDVYKRFDTVVALDGAHVAIPAGSVMALLGGNGSGKSTLAKVITGAIRPDRATYRLDGTEVRVQGPTDAMRLGVSATYQETSLLSHLTVEENLLVGASAVSSGRGGSRQSAVRDARTILERLGIPDLSNLKVRDLSLSARYLVEFARALLVRPRYLILDELTSALRRRQVDLVKELVQELKQQGVGILFISHRLEEVYQMCDAVTVLRNGRVVAEGQLDSFTPRDLVAAMTGAQGDDADLQTFSRPGAQAGERPLLEVVNMRLPVYNGEVTLLGWPGEILGIAGLQGQGQSEFLRVLYGAWPGWTVNLCVDGQEVTIRGIADAVRSGFAFISGDREGEMIFPSRSIWENLKVVSWALSRSGSDDVTGIARHLGLGQYRMSTPASRLSGGSQQKLAVGRWMAVRPRVILADDPTRGVDVGTRREIHNFLRGMAAQGSLVLFSSSQDSELVDLCSRVYVMYRGRLVAELHGEQVKEHEIAATSMQATLEA